MPAISKEKFLEIEGVPEKLQELAEKHGFSVEELLNVIQKESNFDTSAENSKSSATGLIQFMPETAKGLGTSIEEVSSMNAVDQLDLVDKYFTQNHQHGQHPYITIAYPAAGKMDMDDIIADKDSKIASQNPVWTIKEGPNKGDVSKRSILAYAGYTEDLADEEEIFYDENTYEPLWNEGELPAPEDAQQGAYYKDPKGNKYHFYDGKYNEVETPAVKEEKEEVVEEVAETPVETPVETQTSHLKRIFDYASDDLRKWYTGSYDDFKKQYSTEENQFKLYDVLKKKKLIGDATRGQFLDKVFPIVDEEQGSENEVVTPVVAESKEFVIPEDYVVDPNEQWQRYMFDDFKTDLTGHYYNEESGFQSKENILKQYNEEGGVEETGMSFEEFLLHKDYTNPEAISKERTKNQLKKQLYGDEGDVALSKEDVNFNVLKEYLTGATSPIANLNLNITSQRQKGNRFNEQLMITAPSLVGIKFNGEDLVDEDGVASIYTKKDGYIKEDAFLEIIRLLDEQKNNEKGDLTILNSLFTKVTTGSSIRKDDKLDRAIAYFGKHAEPASVDELLGFVQRHPKSSAKNPERFTIIQEKLNNELMPYTEGIDMKVDVLKVWGKLMLTHGDNVTVMDNTVELTQYIAENFTKEEYSTLTKNVLKAQKKVIEEIDAHKAKVVKGITNSDIWSKHTSANNVEIASFIVGDKIRVDGVSPEETDWMSEKLKNGEELNFEDYKTFEKKRIKNEIEEYGESKELENQLTEENLASRFELLQIFADDYEGKKDQYRAEILYDKTKSYIQGLKENKDLVLLSELDEVLYVNSKGEETVATPEQITNHIKETFKIGNNKLKDAGVEIENAMQGLADLGYNVSVSEDGVVTYDYYDPKKEPLDNAFTSEFNKNLDYLHSAIDKRISIAKENKKEFDEISLLMQKINDARAGDEFTLDFVRSQEFVEMDYGKNFMKKLEAGTNNVVFGIPALLGNQYSKDILKQDAINSQYMRSYEWGEGSNWLTAGMVVADQGANMAFMVGTMGVGTALNLSRMTTMGIVSTGIGLQSGGGQLVNLETQEDAAIKANEDMLNLQAAYSDGVISEKNFKVYAKNLNEIIDGGYIDEATGRMDATKKFQSVTQRILLEGGLTFGFGMFGGGSLNTARNIQKVFMGARNSGFKGIMDYNKRTAIKEVIWGTTKGLSTEEAEELLIYGTTEFTDGLIFNRSADYSQAKKVMWDTAVMAGGSNSMSLTYATIMNHNMRVDMRDKFIERFQDINRSKDEKAKLQAELVKLQGRKKKAKKKEIQKLNQEIKDKQAAIDVATTDIANKEASNLIDWQNYHIQVLGMNEADQRKIFENQAVLTGLYVKAGITSKDINDPEIVKQKLDIYKNKLNKEKKGSGDAWLKNYNELKETQEALKDNWNTETAANALYGDNHKETGARKAIQDKIKKDKSEKGKKRLAEYNASDEQNKLRIEFDFLNEQAIANSVNETKNSKKYDGMVDELVAEEAEEVHSITTTDKEGNKTTVNYTDKKKFLKELNRLNDNGELRSGNVSINIHEKGVVGGDSDLNVQVRAILDSNNENNVDDKVTPVKPKKKRKASANKKGVVEEKEKEPVVKRKFDPKNPNKITVTNNVGKEVLTEEQWKKKNGKKRLSKKEKARRDNAWRFIAQSVYADSVRGVQEFQAGDKSARDAINEIEGITGKKLVFDEVGSIEGLNDKINELVELGEENGGLSEEQGRVLKERIKNNRKAIEEGSNGFLLGNKFFVINKEKALEKINNEKSGSETKALAGAVWLHETGHYLDNLTKSVGEISQKGIYINEFLLKNKNKRYQELNDNVENNFRFMKDANGEYYLKEGETINKLIKERKTATGDRKNFIDNLLDEYIREVTQKLGTRKYADLLSDITKRGVSIRGRFFNPNAKIRNANDAMYEAADFINNFREGKISKSFKAQLEAAKGRTDLAGDEKSGMQLSATQDKINKLVRNEDGEVVTKDQYDTDKIGDVAMLLTPGDQTLNGSIVNLGTKIEGNQIVLVPGILPNEDGTSRYHTKGQMIQMVKDQLSTAVINYNPETEYQGVVTGDLSGWLARHIILKKPGVYDQIRKEQEALLAGQEGVTSTPDKIVDVTVDEGTIVFANKLGFKEKTLYDENGKVVLDNKGKPVTRNVFDLIVEEKFREVLAKDPKTYSDTKALLKAEDAILVEVLNLVAKEFGIKPDKLIKDSSLTTTERTSAQLKINKIGARDMLNMMPEGFNSEGDATGVVTVLLNAVNPKTGEPNLLYTKQEDRLKTVKQRVGNKIVFAKQKGKGGGKGLRVQKKNFVDNINEADYLELHGITPVGVERKYRTKDRKVDGPIRGTTMQVAMLIANQSIRKIALENGFYGLETIKSGKADLQLSSVFDIAGQEALQDQYWDKGNEFHENLDPSKGVILDINNPDVLKQQIETAWDKTWPPKQYSWIGTNNVNYRTRAINFYSKTLFARYTKYRTKSIVTEDQDIPTFLEFLKAEDSKRDDGFDTISKILGVEAITKLFRKLRVPHKTYQRTNAEKYITKLKEEGLTDEQAREKAVGDYIRYKSFLENGTVDPRRGMTFGDEKGAAHNEFYTKEFLAFIYPELVSYKKGPKVLDIDKVSYVLTLKDGSTKTIEVTKAWPQVTGDNMLATTNLDGTIDSPMTTEEANARKKDSDEAFKFYDDITAIAAETSKAMGKNGAEHFAMHMASMNANMKTPLRRGAVFTYAALDAPTTALKDVSGKTFEFEHGMPAKIVNGLMIGRHWFDNGVKLETIQETFIVGALHRDFNNNVGILFGSRMNFNYQLGDSALKRWFNQWTQTGASHALYNVFTGEIEGKQQADAWETIKKGKNVLQLSSAINFSRTTNESQGITVLDFDDTLATTESLVKYTKPDGATGTLNAEEFASTYEDLQDQGYTFDFSDFNKVVKGKLAPLFQKALKLQGKFGPENMFVLTARPPAAQKAIFDFLKANGLNIPMKNITGLGNSTSEAKALWIADKVADGYNDFYFADDALQNVQAVKNMLDQFDVKSKVQQAKIQLSSTLDNDFNNILESVTGIESKKRFSDIKARKRGESKGKFRFFIPPSHEDFVGLLYNFMGKGRRGDAHRDFFEQNLIRPLNRAYRELNTAKQSIANDYKQLNKQFPKVKKKLNKKTPDGDFTFQDAVRVYLWNKHGHAVPGLSPTDQAKLTELVANDSELQTYAETLNAISKQDAYVNPTENWEAGDIRMDLDDATGRVGRQQFFSEFFENADIIFSQENLNKIEAAYGAGMVSALKDILYRTKTGRNRPSGQNKMVNQFLNYLNGSVASTMFFNIRSAVLQQMSMVNFINYGDNNIFAAAKAFANQKQYWNDWATIFNSDFMKQRRGGIMTDVNGAELAASVKGATNPIQAVIKKLLELGFLPTQIGDNIAIATGGATYLRNRINTYLKQGFSKAEAEAKAWTDFQVLAESTQQSARPDMISQQQASPLGKVILAFQNVTSQFNRLGKKAFLDIKNRRISPEYRNASNPQLQSDMSNLSRIAYYFAIQNLIFYSLQSALFMMMFDDDEEDERFLKKKERMINGSIDSVLRGTGVWGAVVSTLKNMAIKWHEQRDKGWNKDESAVLMEMLNVSPPLGIKARKMVNAEKTLNYNKSVIEEMNIFDIDNPMWSAVTSYTEAITNVPLNRLYNKTQNIRESLDNQHNAFERVLMFSGWSKWNLGIGDSEKIKEVKETVKKKKEEESKIKSKKKREEKEKEVEAENKVKIKENKKKSKKDGICAAISSSGKRCKNKAIKDGFCTIHEETEKLKDGKKVQCKKRKDDGTRCKMKTSNKSKYCYYHD